MTRPGIEPRSPGPLTNTLTARPMSGASITSPKYQIMNARNLFIYVLFNVHNHWTKKWPMNRIHCVV